MVHVLHKNQNLQSLQLTNQSQQISDKAHDFLDQVMGMAPAKNLKPAKSATSKLANWILVIV